MLNGVTIEVQQNMRALNATLAGTKSINKKHFRKKKVSENIMLRLVFAPTFKTDKAVKSLSDGYINMLADYTDSAEVQLKYATIFKNKTVSLK